MTGSGESVETTIGELVELEEELKTSGGGVGATYDRGTIAGVSKLPVAEVPEEYPVPIDTTFALHIEVDTEGGSVPVFIEWPDEGETSEHIDTLLDALGRSPDEFANIYGDPIALDVEDNWHGIDVEGTRALQDETRQGGDLGDALAETASAASDIDKDPIHLALVALVLGAGFSFATVDTPLMDAGLWLMVLSWPGVPIVIYLDISRVEKRTGWEPTTGAWVVGGIVPFVNVAVGAAYLVERHIRVVGASESEGAAVWMKALIVSVLMPILALPVAAASPGIGATLLFYGPLLAPVAVYMDAEYVEGLCEWDPFKGGWAVLALVVPVLGPGVYLLRRTAAMG